MGYFSLYAFEASAGALPGKIVPAADDASIRACLSALARESDE
jgi:hypothetical protein